MCGQCRVGLGGVCIFCHESSGSTYVPVHWQSNSVSADEVSGDMDESELLPASARTRRVYTEALVNHCACSKCWLRWEAQQTPSSDVDPIVPCPLCHLAVDIRAAYDEALCGSCQRAVVPSERLPVSWTWRDLLGLVALCSVFGCQAMFITGVTMYLLQADQLESRKFMGLTSTIFS
uniref:Uncharacterized protein n=1 Tax=Noctiluca scintillans TaxID=2966 RepID=A0A7S1AKW1_NOCSC